MSRSPVRAIAARSSTPPTGVYMASGRAAFRHALIGELPADHVTSETTMSGGESLWRANWSERADPFAHVQRGSGRGPGWQRASMGGFTPSPTRIVEARVSAVSLGNKGRSDVSIGLRVFHAKFGYGLIAEIEGNKLEIDFETAGRKAGAGQFRDAGLRINQVLNPQR